MINWTIIPMVYNDSFTYMEWLGKLSYIADNHETRIDDLEKNVTDITETLADHEEILSDHEGRITTLENWRRDTVDPFIVDADFRLDTLENWKTNTIEPFMINTANTFLNHNNRITAAEEDIVDLELKKGNLSIFPEITTSIDYTMEIETANCNVYYKNPNSDIWHEYATDTTMNDFIINETSASIGDKDFLFLFCPPEGYPEEQFIFNGDAVVTATAATSEDSAAAIYSRETIPTEDFNSGLELCAQGVVTTESSVDTVVITNTEKVQNYSCLYLSNNFALALTEPGTYSFGVTTSEVFGTMYNQETGENVIPRIRIDGTLGYDAQGRLGLAMPTIALTQDEYDAMTTHDDNTLYIIISST